ncbi:MULTISPECIES: GPW/gp25 family protein [unclassified Acidocella]|uniref:GPW/gp25 family protein n=1 Tax=unclassified Acidocella TaxID=2648610 RepID=UPI00028D4C33|nr:MULTISPECIES: GPW/gp25 family protein [unclassified Acidocella]EKN00976.1 hypothetical protein MXAZACID_02425 [Acidocella sp. MX-AZ02]WBO60543.1 GPW/gp25 family protein [Acidocella sp. MX-AZ03]
MIGTDANTGKALGDIAHLRQSIRDILSTPLGSRVKRRTYGSDLYKLIDAPLNRSTLAQIYSATVGALQTWEPRILVLKVQATAAPGVLTLDLYGQYLPNGQQIALPGISVTT